MKTFKDFIKEDAPANSVGAGGMQGLSSAQGNPIAGYDTILTKKILRRKPHDVFGGKAVFKVNSEAFNKAIHGKLYKKRYSSYVGRDGVGQEIREYAKQNPTAPIIVQDEITGAMYYLRRGKKK
jgi:hypothetical protein